MKLDRVRISNFRSIKDITVEFNPTCRVLVGINESGKSNILKALSFLGDEHVPNKNEDIREELPSEDEIEESLVIFTFKFVKQELEQLFEIVLSQIASASTNPEILLGDNENFDLKQYCALYNEGIYSINIMLEKKSYLFPPVYTKCKLSGGWKKPTNNCPKDFSVELNGQKFLFAQCKLIQSNDFKDIPENYWQDATMIDLISIVGHANTSVTMENLPETLFWKYDENNLLPNSIKIDDFANNPNLCVPLMNMFKLAGINDIKSSLMENKDRTINKFQNYLDRVAKQTTNHFKNVWKEYKDIEFSLKLNGDQIVPGIKELNIHDFASRSDGFKRFVTFLLLISVNVKTNHIKNTLLLIDEPDISLHPSGNRYLRDELIHIAKTNYVVYSTHSIFMIDSNNIGRHYIVKKEKEITTISSAEESDISDEEVLFRALGFSIYQILKEKNIIFEGWNDKRLFQVYLEKASPELKKKYKNVGICHARGVKNIKTITPMIEFAKRECLIISDCDTTAIDIQRHYEREKGYGLWKNYQTIDSSIEAITGEDFLTNDYIAKQIKSVLTVSPLPAFDKTILPEKKGKIEAIHKWLTGNGLTKENANEKIKEVKNSLFENLKHQHIDEDYKKLLMAITL